MDVKKLAAWVMAFGVAVTVIEAASPSALAWIDVALIGLLYVIRRNRLSGVATAPNARLARR